MTHWLGRDLRERALIEQERRVTGLWPWELFDDATLDRFDSEARRLLDGCADDD